MRFFKSHQRIVRLSVLLAGSVVASAADQSVAGEPSAAWHDEHYPARVTLKLASPISDPARVKVNALELSGLLTEACIDPVSPGTLAYERAIVVHPVTGKVVGRFQLVYDSRGNLVRDPTFASIGTDSSPWINESTSGSCAVGVDVDGRRVRALEIQSGTASDTFIRQDLTADPGEYLFDYWIFNDPTIGTASVAIEGATASYVPLLPQPKKWTHVRQLCQVSDTNIAVTISQGFAGKAILADPMIHRASWQLVMPEALSPPTDRLHLYYVPRAGRELTVPAVEHLLAESDAPAESQLASMKADARHPNPDGRLLHDEPSLAVWTVPTNYPLRADRLARTRPAASSARDPLEVRLYHGTDATFLVAIETGSPRLTFVSAGHDLPSRLPLRVEYAAPVPVNDRPYPEGKLLEVRLDALMDPADPLLPPNPAGVHVLAFTLSPVADLSGTFEGTIDVKVRADGSQAEQTIAIPIRVHVSPLVIKPTHHFGTSFSGAHIGVIYRASDDGMFTRDSLTVAQFHGYDIPAMYETIAFRTTYADRHEPSVAPVRQLAWDYYHRMLDYHVLPETLGLWSAHTYRIDPQPDGKAPRLTDWDFTHFDEAIDEFLVKRDVPWFTIYRSNGNWMHRLELADGKIYSYRPPEEGLPWVQLTEDEYFALVSEYFDAIARRLEERGFGDRALYVIDECHVDSFDTIYKYWKALQARSYARKIRFGHTAFVTDVFTARSPNDQQSLLMADVLDVPMPLNDDEWNFFEPTLNEPWRKPGQHQWVYYMKSDHLRLHTAGFNTVAAPLKLDHFGASGWYCWASFIWDMPWKNENLLAVNPWQNSHSWYDSGGLTSFFYPPDPRGPSKERTSKLVPSYRLSLMRDGIADVALLHVARRGVDDAGQPIAVDAAKLAAAEAEIDRLWADNPVQWYVSDASYSKARQLLWEAVQP